jgi:hypothetical protein
VNRKNLNGEVNNINKNSIKIAEVFSIAGNLALIAGILAVSFFGNVENGRYLLLMALTLLSEGIWGGVLIDCAGRKITR